MNIFTENFLGRGWKFPIEFKKDKNTSTGTVTMLEDIADISNSLYVLFKTRVGERIMHANYGSALENFLFMPINVSTITYMQEIISDEILFNEPRIILNNVEIAQSVEDAGRLEIRIDYTINSTNNRYNYVYPFYVIEATNLVR
ncbi:MAG: GPW/gp25 family protein [Ferruginibacter sp.]